MTSEKSSATVRDNEILITRVFAAPRKLVWEVWTRAEHLPHWFGPKGFSTRVTEHDFRTGGKWRYVMIGPDGAEYPALGVFQEIVPLERIVTTDNFEEGFQYKNTPDLPKGIILTSLFEDLGDKGDKTRVTLRILHPSLEDRQKHEKMGVIAGWNSTLDRLEEHLLKQ